MYCKIQLIGNLGKEVETKDSHAGLVAKFSVATTERLKNEKKTEWHNVVCFGKLAEIARDYLKKGSLVMIEGKLQSSEYEKDGVKMRSYSIVCSEFKMLGGGSESSDKPQKTSNKPAQIDDLDSDIPF